MNWFMLFLAGLCEIVWAVSSKYIIGFSKPLPIIITGIGYICSMLLLIKVVKTIPLGTAYAIWMSIGIMGTSIYGMIILGESMTLIKLMFLCFIVIGVFGLKFIG